MSIHFGRWLLKNCEPAHDGGLLTWRYNGDFLDTQELYDIYVKDLDQNILEFIENIREADPDMVRIYTQGGCYRFFLILKAVYPTAEAWHDSDHVITRIGDTFYDITGEVSEDKYLPMCTEQHKVYLDSIGRLSG